MIPSTTKCELPASLQWRVVGMKEGGSALHAIAQHLHIPHSTVSNICRHFRNTNTIGRQSRKVIERSFIRHRVCKISRPEQKSTYASILTRQQLKWYYKQRDRRVKVNRCNRVTTVNNTDSKGKPANYPVVQWILKNVKDTWLQETTKSVMNGALLKKMGWAYFRKLS